MAKISHFVVTYNHETKEWDIDTDTVQALGGTIFDTVSEEWENTSPQTRVVDGHAANILFDAVNELEEPNG